MFFQENLTNQRRCWLGVWNTSNGWGWECQTMAMGFAALARPAEAGWDAAARGKLLEDRARTQMWRGAGGQPRPTYYTVSMEHQEKKKLRCREHTLPDMLSHTQSHDIALSHNLNWIPRASRVPCSPKALCMFSECLAYAAVTWALLRSLSLSFSLTNTDVHLHMNTREVLPFSH